MWVDDAENKVGTHQGDIRRYSRNGTQAGGKSSFPNEQCETSNDLLTTTVEKKNRTVYTQYKRPRTRRNLVEATFCVDRARKVSTKRVIVEYVDRRELEDLRILVKSTSRTTVLGA